MWEEMGYLKGADADVDMEEKAREAMAFRQ